MSSKSTQSRTRNAIQEYADAHGFVIVKTYSDAGKSDVAAKSRIALLELFKEVASGTAKYKAILVYEVSRWGRFPSCILRILMFQFWHSAS
jgi:DNA invertase Pin-like site-specific DNA recombinase